MSAFQLKHTPDETSYDDGAAFTPLKACLQGEDSTSAEATAKKIAATLPGPPEASGSDAQWSLYNLLIGTAKQIPHDDPALVKLVDVVDHLSLSPKTAFSETVDGFETINRLHTLGWNLRDIFAPPFDSNQQPSQEQLGSYLSLQAFMALLWSRNLINGYDFSLWKMRSALEEDCSGPQAQEYEVAAAGLWVVHAGSRIWQLAVNPPPLVGRDDKTLRAGSKFEGSAGYGKARWAFWVEKFEERSAGEGVDGKIAARAAKIMRGLEG